MPLPKLEPHHIFYLHISQALLFKLLQFTKCRFDSISDDGRDGKSLVQVAFVCVAIAFKDEEVTILGDIAANGPNGISVKKFLGWATELLSLEVIL